MRMFGLVAAGLCGLLVGHLLWARDAAPLRTAAPPPASQASPGDTPLATALPESQAPHDPPPAPERSRRTTREADGDIATIRALQTRVLELQQELERLRATLPPPAILLELERADLDQLQAVSEAVRRVAQEKLLAVPEHATAPYRDFLEREGAGAARLLPRGRYDSLVQHRGGGAYYSFATRSHSYDREPDLSLESGRYTTSFYGGTFGFLMAIPDTPVEWIPDGPAAAPSSLPATQLEAWSFLWSEVGADRRAFQARARRLGLRESIEAKTHETYLLRSCMPGEHDILVAFRNVHRDDRGDTLVWRVLRRWDLPR